MSHLKMMAWGLEKMMVRVQAVATISLARLLCAAQLRDSSGDWMVISLPEVRQCFRYFWLRLGAQEVTLCVCVCVCVCDICEFLVQSSSSLLSLS